MEIPEIIILAVVQGIAEFLPISSSGHLVVAAAVMEMLGRPMPAHVLEVNIVLHVATLLAVLVVYGRAVARLFRHDWRVWCLLFVATLPAAVAGLWIKRQFPQLVESPLLAGLMFPLTALLLVRSAKRPEGSLDYNQLSYSQAFWIGCLQALAILPGISRSGATIAAGLTVGLQRSASATFAFLLAIPIIGGAGLLELKDMIDAGGSTVPVSTLVVGFVVAFLVGLIALKLLIRIVERGQLQWFVYYLVPLGLIVTVWQLFWAN